MEAFMYRHHPAMATRQSNWLPKGKSANCKRFNHSSHTSTLIRTTSAIRRTSAAAVSWTSAAIRYHFRALSSRPSRSEFLELSNTTLSSGPTASLQGCLILVAVHRPLPARRNWFPISASISSAPKDASKLKSPSMRRPMSRVECGTSAAKRLKRSSLDICDQYTIQGDLFSQAILNDTEAPTPLADAVENMRVLERLIASGKSGCWA